MVHRAVGFGFVIAALVPGSAHATEVGEDTCRLPLVDHERDTGSIPLGCPIVLLRSHTHGDPASTYALRFAVDDGTETGSPRTAQITTTVISHAVMSDFDAACAMRQVADESFDRLELTVANLAMGDTLRIRAETDGCDVCTREVTSLYITAPGACPQPITEAIGCWIFGADCIPSPEPPPPEPPPNPLDDDGGCSAGSSSSSAALVVLAAMALRRRRRF